MAVAACPRGLEQLAARPRPHRLALAVLTDLQRQIGAIVAELPEGAAITLADGSALIATGVVRRGIEELDFFTAPPESVTPVLSAIGRARSRRTTGYPLASLTDPCTAARTIRHRHHPASISSPTIASWLRCEPTKDSSLPTRSSQSQQDSRPLRPCQAPRLHRLPSARAAVQPHRTVRSRRLEGTAASPRRG